MMPRHYGFGPERTLGSAAAKDRSEPILWKNSVLLPQKLAL